MMNNIFQMYQQLRQNPMQMLARRFNIPSNVNMNDPNSIIQYLINSGQVSQQQVNQMMTMRNDPTIRQLMGRK